MATTECFFAALPGAGPCDGQLRACHLIPKATIKAEFPRGAVRALGERAWRPLGRSGDLRAEGATGEFMPLPGLQQDPRVWVPGCGGQSMGNAGHHGQFKPDGPRPVPREALPAGLEEFAAELGLGWWLDRTYGERTTG